MVSLTPITSETSSRTLDTLPLKEKFLPSSEESILMVMPSFPIQNSLTSLMLLVVFPQGQCLRAPTKPEATLLRETLTDHLLPQLMDLHSKQDLSMVDPQLELAQLLTTQDQEDFKLPRENPHL